MKVIIVGGGQVGSHLGSLLLGEGHWVRVIEATRARQERLRRDLPDEAIVLGSGSDPDVLESAGIRQANVLAAVTGADEVNLVATMLARFEFGTPRIIGRINNPRNAWLYTPEMGVDVALNQADLLARLVAEEMSLGDMMTLLKLRKGLYSLVEEKVAPGAPADGATLRDLPIPAQSALVAIIRKGELIMPRPEVRLQPADQVLAVVHASQVDAKAELLGKRG